LVLNKIKAGFKVCVVKTPRLNKSELTEDISAVTGAMILNDTFEKALPGHLGSAEKIVVDKHTTTIINGRGDILAQHIARLKEKEQLERASKLEGGIATLYVGANSEVELIEKKDRIEDALCATKAAIAEGIIPGGGSVYIGAVTALDAVCDKNHDIDTGINIIRQALLQPLKQICSNAGVSGDIVIGKIIHARRQHDNAYGYNAKTEEYGDLLDMGVIDPAKAVRVALENAASVAGLFLTTECVIVDDIE
jgi:chaperonin GroEL